METETSQLQHPDFIWTWRETGRGRRQSIWIPYLQSIANIPHKKNLWRIAYNGGEAAVDLSQTDFIMLYGACGTIPVEFLDALNAHRVCLSIHRRNMPRPYLFLPASGADDDDILTAQVAARANELKAAYVARTLIREKLASTRATFPVSSTDFARLAATRTVAEARAIEARQAAKYWRKYFETLGVSIARRSDPHPVTEALDAGSHFLQGIILRWALFHKMSPYHGFLHRPTDYVSLVFDFIEPYRWWIDTAVADAAKRVGVEDGPALVAASIDALKAFMEEPVYVPATRQTVRRKSLLHGIVLATRAWLMGKQTRFVIPVEGQKKGGRPPEVGFKIPGYGTG